MTKKKTTRKPAAKKPAARKKTKAEQAAESELHQWIAVVVLVAVTAVAYLQMGVVGEFMSRLCRFLFGKFYFVLLTVIVIQILITMINRRNGNTSSKNPLAIIIIILAILLLCSYLDTNRSLKGFEIAREYIANIGSFFSPEPAIPVAGGIIGALLFSLTSMLVDRIGTVLIIIVLFVIAALLLVNLDVYKQAFRTIWTYLSTTEEDDEDEDEEEDEDVYEPEEVYDSTPFEPEMIEPVKELPKVSSQPKIRMLEVDSRPEKVEPIAPAPAVEEDDTPIPMTGFDDEYPSVSKNSRMSIMADDGNGEDDYIRSWEDDLPPVPEEKQKAEDENSRTTFMTVDELYDNTVQPSGEEMVQDPSHTPYIPPAPAPYYPPEPSSHPVMEMPSVSQEDPALKEGAHGSLFQQEYVPPYQQDFVPPYEQEYIPPLQQEYQRPAQEEYVPPVAEYQPRHESSAGRETHRTVSEEPTAKPVQKPAAPVPAAPAAPVTPPPVRRPDRPYQLPRLNLLDPIPPKPKDDINEAAAREKGELLVQALRNFDIESRLIDTHIGPSVTKFEIRPDANVKVSRISGLADDIKMQLAVRDVRIEAPIPGHNAVGVEIPNQKATPVKMKELFSAIPESDANQPLLIVLGKDLMGNVVTCRLDKMPHMLIAGATGSGKSVCMNSIITSILLRTKPDEVKLLLVDPKKVEFTPYQKIPHLIGPVINDPSQASNALKVIVKIMDERYDAFAKAGVRNIQGFNSMVASAPPTQPDGSPSPKKMPYIVVIVDEMADLMNVAGKEVESSIQRITQLARAAGIHLIVATQRPSTDVITGVIKANIPSRIAFAVSSGIDSRTILDHVGAERLLGNGDMLYMPIGSSNAVRVQGVFITDDEVKRITDFVSSEAVPMYDDAFIRLEGVNDGEGGVGGIAGAAEDPMFNEIRDYVIEVQKASTSLLQRRFGIGYNRAARMIDLLEEKGIIGPAQGSKPREVYIKKEDE